ncbi:MAG: response regulator [Patescibacteria group bacterium]|nr:response regulator [Patescibacteria group bacterium]
MGNLLKILIVEDDELLREMYKSRFLKEHFEVFTAGDGREGLDLVMTKMPNIVILDLMLPEKGGIGVLQILKSRIDTKDIPVIILTAYPRQEYRMLAEKYGAKMFLSKAETQPGKLVEIIKEIIK